MGLCMLLAKDLLVEAKETAGGLEMGASGEDRDGSEGGEGSHDMSVWLILVIVIAVILVIVFTICICCKLDKTGITESDKNKGQP